MTGFNVMMMVIRSLIAEKGREDMGRSFCQSCGMPMDKDSQGGATLKDGTKSDVYCSLCMADGVFFYQGDDVKDYQKMVVSNMVKNGWWRPIAWLATRQIPKLDRWRTKP